MSSAGCSWREVRMWVRGRACCSVIGCARFGGVAPFEEGLLGDGCRDLALKVTSSKPTRQVNVSS